MAGKCVTLYCRNNRAKHKSKCHKCKSKWLKERHFAAYTLNQIRCAAKRRGIPFTLTLKYFIDFCAETGYLVLKGKNPDSLTVDRINHDYGYVAGNIKVSTHKINSYVGHYVPPNNYANYEREDEQIYAPNEPF